MPITSLLSSATFRDWFTKTNTIISEFNTLQAIGVTGISGSNGIGVSYGNGLNTIFIKNTIPNSITFSGNVNIVGNTTISGTLNVGNLNVNKTVLSYSPKKTGLTAGNVVRIDSVIGLTFAKADTAENAEILGVVIGEDSTYNYIAVSGKIDNSTFNNTISNALKISGATLGYGAAYFLDPVKAGGLTSIEPNIYGQVSKPVLMGITGSEGVILPYRGVIIEGISAGITAELDNKIILTLNYGAYLSNFAEYTGVDTTTSLTGPKIKVGDPLFYFGGRHPNMDPSIGDPRKTVAEVLTILKNDYDITYRFAGENADATIGAFCFDFNSLDLKTDQTNINKVINWWTMQDFVLGLVSKVLSIDTVAQTAIIEITTPGGKFDTNISELDSGFYNYNSQILTSGPYFLTGQMAPDTGSRPRLSGHYMRDFNYDNYWLDLYDGAGGAFNPGGGVGEDDDEPRRFKYLDLLVHDVSGNCTIIFCQQTASEWGAKVEYSFMSGLNAFSAFASGSGSGSTLGITLTNSNDLLLNGNFNVWQRGYSAYSGVTKGALSGVYTPVCDRWFLNIHGCTAVSLNLTRQEFDTKQTDVEGAPRYWIDYSNTYTTYTSGNAAQRPKLENISRGARLLQGQQATVSFYAKAGITGATVDVFYNRYNDKYSTVVGLSAAIESRYIVNEATGISLSADWKEYTRTFILEQGITLTSTEEGWFGLGFEFPNSTTYSIAQVRLNYGDYSTKPVYKVFEEELKASQKYYQKSYSLEKLPQSIDDNNWNEASLDLMNLNSVNEYFVKYPVPMNYAPKGIRIYSTYSGLSGEAYNTSAGADLRNVNGTVIKVPWTTANSHRYNAKTSGNIDVGTITKEGFTVVVSGGAYSGDRIKFHWVADADVDKLILE